ncbi:MAG: hypothetical protein ACP5I1_09645, partial [Candidatus Hinthialibacter sp.]
GVDGVPSSAPSILSGFNAKTNMGLDAAGTCLPEDTAYSYLDWVYFSTEFDDDADPLEFKDGDLLVHRLSFSSSQNALILTNSQLTGYRTDEYGLDGVDLYPGIIDVEPTNTPAPTFTFTPTIFIPTGDEGCVSAGDVFTTEASGLSSINLGAVMIYQSFLPSDNPDMLGDPIDLSVVDCSDDGKLDVWVPWTEAGASQLAAIQLSPNLCGGSAPQQVEVILKHGYECKLNAYDDAGNLVATAAASSDTSVQTLTLTSASGIRIIEIVGAEICILEICWECEIEEEPTPTYTPTEEDEGLGPDDGIRFYQVDFQYENAQWENSSWGRMEIDPQILFEKRKIRQGFLNVYSDLGWHVVNMPITEQSLNEGLVSTYLNLGLVDPNELEDINKEERDAYLREKSALLTEFSAYVAYTEQPLEKPLSGKLALFPLEEKWIWNAQGVSDQAVYILDIPPVIVQIPDFVWEFLFESHTQPQSANVECAYNQCFPMSISNSLQYLENEFGLGVPHNHVMGLKGDNSLVGQLDSYANRSVTDRRHGSGTWFTPMVNGKFKYLSDNNLNNSLIHKYQGRGWGSPPTQALPTGDYSAHGSTLQDEGAAVTFDWICEQIKSGEDVELVFSYDDAAGNATGGHAVRVFECGRILGKPYVKYLHDSNQGNDSAGLETVQVYVEDLDGDGMLNLGTQSREIRFAMAESFVGEAEPTATPTPKDCYPDLPAPELMLENIKLIDVNGQPVYEYNLDVPNWSAYPDSLFEAAPDLPPCGGNANASRTWVDIYNGETNTRIFGFCAFGSAADLNFLWFRIPSGEPLPNNVYILMTDRRCDLAYRSETIALELPTPTPTPRPSATPVVGPVMPHYDDLVVAQGFGGQTLVNIRYFNEETNAFSSIRRSFIGIPPNFLSKIGGGQGRSTYAAVGDLNCDDVEDIVNSFGPILEPSEFPNIIVARNESNRMVVGHSFVGFPTGDETLVQYNGGEVRTAVGDFTRSGQPQMAVVQGYGGNGIVRLYQY